MAAIKAHNTHHNTHKKRILYLIAEDQYFYSHRLNLAKEALQAGFEVAIASRFHSDTIREKELAALGIKIFALQHFNRTNINPLKQMKALREINKIYQHYKPDIVHHVAIKPIILGSIAAHLNKTPKIINALGGLGYLFTEPFHKPKKILMRFIVKRILKWIFNKRNTLVILQNPDDFKVLMRDQVIVANKTKLIAGSGVDTQAFPETLPPPSPPIVISCVSRMLWDKGIGELVKAAEILHSHNIIINLYGLPDPENPASIPLSKLEEWNQSGIIRWQKYCSNVAGVYSDCHIAVLPSYREGLPKSLLEAASCGRPIVTTNVPGCKEVVKPGKNGLLAAPRDPKSLAEALNTLIQDEALRLQMGKESRRFVEAEFSDKIINNKVIELYKSI